MYVYILRFIEHILYICVCVYIYMYVCVYIYICLPSLLNLPPTPVAFPLNGIGNCRKNLFVDMPLFDLNLIVRK